MSSESKNYASFVKSLPRDLRSVAQKLHQVLIKINPEFEVKKAWGGLGYKRDKSYSCLVAPYKDHLKLMIWRGVDLKDPKGKLEGTGSNTRHIKYFPTGDVDGTYLKKLLTEQFKLYGGTR